MTGCVEMHGVVLFDDSLFDAEKNYPVANEEGKTLKKKGREKGLQTG